MMGGQGLRILQVEDNPADAELVRLALRSWKAQPHTLACVARLAEALPVLVGRRADVVLLDLTLPDSAGLATVERTVAIARDIPVIVLTGTDDDQLGLASIEAGAADYICKGEIRSHTLRRGIMFVLERRRQQQIRFLNEAVARYRELIAVGASEEAVHAGEGTLQQRNPDVAAVIAEHYADVLDAYVENVGFDSAKPTDAMSSVAASLGELGAGPRDLIVTHAAAVERARETTGATQAKALTTAARQLAIEMMSLLCDFYRAGRRRRSPSAATGQRRP